MKKILAFTLVSALMTGCGGGSNGGDQDSNSLGNDSGSGSSQDSNGSSSGSGQATVLEGTWRKPCGPVSGQEHHDIVTFTSTGNTFTSSIENYIDASCTTPYAEAPNPTASGTFTLGDNVVLGDGVTATEHDSHITQSNGAPFIIDDYNIIYIQDDTLYIGEGEAETPEQRPTTLDYSRPYYRVN